MTIVLTCRNCAHWDAPAPDITTYADSWPGLCRADTPPWSHQTEAGDWCGHHRLHEAALDAAFANDPDPAMRFPSELNPPLPAPTDD